jgi:hypothetical protein
VFDNVFVNMEIRMALEFNLPLNPFHEFSSIINRQKLRGLNALIKNSVLLKL